MVQDHLVPCAISRDIEAFLSVSPGERPEPLPRRRSYGEEQDVSLIALEGVGVAASPMASRKRFSMYLAWSEPTREMTPRCSELYALDPSAWI